jgi:hypothetical protein
MGRQSRLPRLSGKALRRIARRWNARKLRRDTTFVPTSLAPSRSRLDEGPFWSFLTEMGCPDHVRFTPKTTELRTLLEVRLVPILLRKSGRARWMPSEFIQYEVVVYSLWAGSIRRKLALCFPAHGATAIIFILLSRTPGPEPICYAIGGGAAHKRWVLVLPVTSSWQRRGRQPSPPIA